MKFILGSNGTFVLDSGFKALDLSKEEMNVGYIDTAATKSKDRSFADKHLKKAIESGYKYTQFDITGKSLEQIGEFFKDKNVLYMEGGNTFYLLRVIRETGFDIFLKEYLSAGNIYIGVSAGSYVMCPTIEVADWNKDGKDRFGITDFTGLSYVNFALKAHFKDEMYESLKQNSKTLRHPLKILRDGQGYLIEDENCRLIGIGDEVKLD